MDVHARTRRATGKVLSKFPTKLYLELDITQDLRMTYEVPHTEVAFWDISNVSPGCKVRCIITDSQYPDFIAISPLT